MTVTYGNLIEGRGKRVLVVLLPVVLLPLALAGVTIKPILHLRDASLAVEDAQARASQAEGLRNDLQKMGSLSQSVGQALALEQALQRMVPGQLRTLEVYSVLRRTAQVTGFTLNSLQVDEPVAFLPALDGNAAGSRSVRLRGIGDSSGISAFVDQLRAAGLPVAVKSFAFVHRKTGLPFDIDLQIDVFHRIPPVVDSVEDSLVSEGETTSQ